MRKSKKQQKQGIQQKQAIQYLSILSASKTNYLQNWSKINEIQQISEQGQQADGVNQLKGRQTEKSNKPIRQLNNKRIQQQRHQKVAGNAFEVEFKSFVRIPHESNLMKNRISQFKIYKNVERTSPYQTIEGHYRYQNSLQKAKQSNRQQNPQPKKQQKSQGKSAFMRKIRQLSLPKLKYLASSYQKMEQTDIDPKIKQKDQARKISQKIRNKVRRKQANRFIIQRQLSNNKMQTQTQLKASQDEQILSDLRKKIKEESEQSIQKNELKLLKSWLDNNRSKKKRSMCSLLNEHFQNKYLEKKRQREKLMALSNLHPSQFIPSSSFRKEK